MTLPQLHLSVQPADRRRDYPEGWLVLESAPGPAWTTSAERVELPVLRRLYPIEVLDSLEDQIRRIRAALAEEARAAELRPEALRNLAHRGVLYAPERRTASGHGATLPEEELSHLGVAGVSPDGYAAEVAAAARVAFAPAQDPEVELLRRVLAGVRGL